MAMMTRVLPALGFRTTAEFQRAWALGPALKVDGVWGPQTAAAGALSLQNRLTGQGDLSEHFSAKEFWCRCGGTLAGCKKVSVHRGLLLSLENLRQDQAPLRIVSGYRCPLHNKVVGGVGDSQHLYGTAADIAPNLSYRQVKILGAFSGIGYLARTSRVCHVDRRDLSPHNPTKSSLQTPAMWKYS